jgi:hypothetical protein
MKTKFEHHQMSMPEDADLPTAIAALGEGWELVAVVSAQNHHGWIIAYLKRRG